MGVEGAHASLTEALALPNVDLVAVAGALYGLSSIPERWLDQVAWKDRLLDTAQRLLPEPVAQPA